MMRFLLRSSLGRGLSKRRFHQELGESMPTTYSRRAFSSILPVLNGGKPPVVFEPSSLSMKT